MLGLGLCVARVKVGCMCVAFCTNDYLQLAPGLLVLQHLGELSHQEREQMCVRVKDSYLKTWLHPVNRINMQSLVYC